MACAKFHRLPKLTRVCNKHEGLVVLYSNLFVETPFVADPSANLVAATEQVQC